jgi:hypothetical protein
MTVTYLDKAPMKAAFCQKIRYKNIDCLAYFY